jgi:lipopolysaccharide biosynthesis regulator YciM
MYQQGDYLRALTIYQAMAKLSDDPEWRWPVIYQVGLCFERLGLPDRATEAYQFIQDENKKAQASSKPIGDDLTQLAQMAEWRSGHVQWQQTTSAQLRDLLGPPTEQGTNPPPGVSAISTTN